MLTWRHAVVVATVGFALTAGSARAAEDLQTVAATSVFVDIEDGEKIFREEWIVGDGTEQAPDTYIPVKSDKPKVITFVTDKGKLSFDTQPDGIYNFVIERGGQRVYTRIDRSNAAPPTLQQGLQASRENTGTAPVELPFTLDQNNGIRMRGTINGSAPLDFAFDTGAKRNYVVKARLANKAPLKFESSVYDVGSDGVSKAEVSSHNRLTIGDLKWENVALVTSSIGNVDAIIGWSAFEGKLIDINYDRNVMTIHESPTTIANGYTKLPLRTYSGSPFVQATVTIGDTSFTDWFLFDSGFNAAMYISNRLAVAHALAGSSSTGKTFSSSANKPIAVQDVAVSRLTIGDMAVNNVAASINVGGPEDVPHNDILGNALLKDFNVVLDIEHDAIYLQRRAVPSASSRRQPWLLYGAGAIGALLLTVVGLLVVRRKTTT